MNHIDPSISSGSSPGVMIAQDPRLPRIPAAVEYLGTSSSFVPPKSLVVSKRKLPAVLRHNVPELQIAGTAAESLIVTPNRLWGVLHPDIGKQIKHKGRAAIITNVHADLRQIEVDGRRFWVPRRAVNRRELKEQRIKRLYDYGIKIAFLSPNFTGEPRPDAETVALPQWENLISQDLYDFATQISQLFRFGKYGNRRCHLISKSSHEQFTLKMQAGPPTRHERTLFEQKKRQKYAALKEKLREHLLRQIIAESRLPEEKQFAVYDVIALGQLTENVAATRGMSSASLGNTVRRVTTKVNERYQETLSREAVAQGMLAVFG